MKASARYAKIVEWSDEDHCYVGSAPGLVTVSGKPPDDIAPGTLGSVLKQAGLQQ